MSFVRIKPPKTEGPWKPTPYFFYGSLMVPSVLQKVIWTPENNYDPVQYRKGSINGFKSKMWSRYPTLVKGDADSVVDGQVYVVETEHQAKRLQEYETDHYTWCYCTVKLEDGSELDKVRVFIWAGDPDSEDLRDGNFCLETYVRENCSYGLH